MYLALSSTSTYNLSGSGLLSTVFFEEIGTNSAGTLAQSGGVNVTSSLGQHSQTP